MAVIRVQKTDNYTVMSNHHLRNKNLSLKAKGLMSLMLSLPPSWDYSIGGLVAICKESHTSIRSALKELEQNHYLIRYRINNEKGYFSYEYNLYEIPEKPHTEKQHTDKAQTAKGHTENAHTENDREINKEELSKEKLNIDILEREESEICNILNEISDRELRELYADYTTQRKEKSAPLTPKGLKMLIERGYRLADNNVAIHRAIVETAIINNWLNLYAPRDEEKLGRNGHIEERKRFYMGN
jgi:hypothetical protein